MCTKTMAPHSSIYHMQKHLQGQMKMFDGAFFGLTALQTNIALEKFYTPHGSAPESHYHQCRRGHYMTAGWSPLENNQLTGGRTVCINSRPHIQPEVLQLPVGALQYAVVVLHGEEFAPLNDVKLQGVPCKSKHHPLSLAFFKLTWRMWIWDVNVTFSAHDRLDLIKS